MVQGGRGDGDKTEGDGESDKEGGMGQPQRANRREIEERKGGEREIRPFSNPAGRSGEMTGQEMPKRMREVALLL